MMGRNVDAIKIKRCHFGASVLILAVELFKFGRTYIVDYDAIDVGSWLKLVIVIWIWMRRYMLLHGKNQTLFLPDTCLSL